MNYIYNIINNIKSGPPRGPDAEGIYKNIIKVFIYNYKYKLV